MSRKLVLLLLLCAMLVGSGGALAQTPSVLRVTATAAITTWDPSLSFSTEALYMTNIYEPLLYANPPGSAQPFRPALATDWSSSADGMTWTFHIRKGVKFHDGETLTAQAVKDSLDRHKKMGGASFIWAPVKSIDVVDDYTVQFNMVNPAPLELILASQYDAWIVSPKALAAAAKDDKYFEQGVEGGTGPYMLDSYTPDSEVVLKAFPDYWGGWSDTNHYQNIVVSIVSDAVTQEQLLTSGGADLALRLPESSYDTFVKDPNYNVQTVQTLFNYVGFLNTTRPPLDNVKVRQAISYAMPYADIIKVGAEGRATQSHGPVPAGVWPYSAEVPQYHQDLDKARELLKEAGHEGGGFDLKLTYAAENTIEASFAPLIADALGQIGINVTIDPMLFNQQWELAKGDPTQAQDIFLLLYWPTYSDAGSDNLYSMFHSSDKPFFNLSYWKDDQFDKTLDQAVQLSGTDRAQSQKLYTEAQTRLVDQAPGLFFMDVGSWYAVPKTIAGFEYNLNYPFAIFFYPLHSAS